jgi:aspartate racemase
LPFQSILQYQESGDSNSEVAVLAEAARVLEDAGVRFGMICSNTTNKTFDTLQQLTSVRFLDIVDAVVDTLRKREVETVGLLGTKHVMERGFYTKRLESAGIEVRVPRKADQEEVHRVIYDELCTNEIRDISRSRLKDVIRRLGAEDCQAVVLGCTELPLLLTDSFVDGVQLISSVDCHLDALYEAVDAAVAPQRQKTPRHRRATGTFSARPSLGDS